MTAAQESLHEVIARLSRDKWTDRPAMMVGGVVDVKAAASFLGISVSGLYEHMGAGLPFVKLGARRVIPKQALVDLLADLAAA